MGPLESGLKAIRLFFSFTKLHYSHPLIGPISLLKEYFLNTYFINYDIYV
ncbi:hypothetical protein Hanom_Chr04g00332401 [Helianthus anomalus]